MLSPPKSTSTKCPHSSKTECEGGEILTWSDGEALKRVTGICVTQVRDLLTNPSAVHEARALLAEQVGKLTLERVYGGGRLSFKANGRLDFLGQEALGRSSRLGFAFAFPRLAA
jgi:hypothetical protein